MAKKVFNNFPPAHLSPFSLSSLSPLSPFSPSFALPLPLGYSPLPLLSIPHPFPPFSPFSKKNRYFVLHNTVLFVYLCIVKQIQNQK